MGKPRMIGMKSPYTPNSKADARHNRDMYQRGRETALRSEPRKNRRERRDLKRLKGE